MVDEWKVSSASVAKYTDSLSLCAGDASESITSRIEYQRSSLGKNIGMKTESRRRWQREYKSSGRLMDV